MPTSVRAAVLRAIGEAPAVEEIALPDPGPAQVRVRLAAAGVCHSDLSLSNGTLRQPVPAVLGHEGAGTVTAVGADVTHVSPGDRVLLNWAPPCGECWFCVQGEPHLCEHAADAATAPYARAADGAELYAGLGTAAFAEETVVPGRAAIRLPADVPLEEAALLGCAVLTGVGAVLNTAAVRPGESVVVLGLGGVGLSALQGARIAEAAPVIAVDTRPELAEIALRLGATDFLLADEGLGKAVRALTGGRGADHAFECVGRAATIRQAWGLTRRGGHTTVVGIGGRDEQVSFSPLELFHFARSLTGCVYGSTDPARDVPLLLEHLRAGRLDLAGLVTRRVGLDGTAGALADLAGGAGTGRTLVVPT